MYYIGKNNSHNNIFCEPGTYSEAFIQPSCWGFLRRLLQGEQTFPSFSFPGMRALIDNVYVIVNVAKAEVIV